MLNRINNAQAVKHETVEIPFSKLKLKITEILKSKGFILDFKKREKMCRTCTKVESSRCTLNHLSNFWFKIDEIREIQNVGSEFANLQDCLTKMSIDFSLPILYPLLVTQIIGRPHF